MMQTSWRQRLSFDHLVRLTDDFGIWQHTDGDAIATTHGYALDDAARALLVALAAERHDLAAVYLGFMERAIAGYPTVVNFFSAARQPVDHLPSHDAIGQVYWALARCRQARFEPERVTALLARTDPLVRQVTFLRSKAYTLLGAQTISVPLAMQYGNDLLTAWKTNRQPVWDWPEPILTYGNAILPLALLEAGQHLNWAEAVEAGVAMLDFLNAVTKVDGVPIAVGNRGWYPRGKHCALYDQQPIDPAYQVIANVTAWKATGAERFRTEAGTYLDWFGGNNLRGESLLRPGDGSVADGLEEQRISPNRGAESVVCYLLAQQVFEAAFGTL